MLTQQRLDADWHAFCSRPSTRRSVHVWRSDARLAAFASPSEIIDATRMGSRPEDSEEILRALAERAPSDPAAARTLLQALLPGLRAAARRFQHRIGDEALAIALGEAAVRISAGVPARRPGRVAANVVMDAKAALLHALNAPQFEPEPPEQAAVEQATASDEVVQLVSEAREAGIVSERAAALIIITRAHGYAIEEVAQASGVAACGLRQLRRRSEARIQQWVPSTELWCASA